jgi:hypothetical protein
MAVVVADAAGIVVVATVAIAETAGKHPLVIVRAVLR